jgi:hypothetical protein
MAARLRGCEAALLRPRGSPTDALLHTLFPAPPQARPSLEELPNCHTLQIDDKERALHTNDLAVRHQTVGNVDLAMQQVRRPANAVTLAVVPRLNCVCCCFCTSSKTAGGSARAGPAQPDPTLQHGPSPRDDRRDGRSHRRVQAVS